MTAKTERIVTHRVDRAIPCLEPRDQRLPPSAQPCPLPSRPGDCRSRSFLQSAGGAWRHLFYVAPISMRPSDLHEHPSGVWHKIQKDPALKAEQLDEIAVLCKDGSWLVIGRALAADDSSVTFKPRE